MDNNTIREGARKVDIMIKRGKKGEKIDRPNGRDAYLPHPFFQHSFFQLARARGEGERRKDQKQELLLENEFGSFHMISGRQLFFSPDMPIFLSVVALAQKNLFEYRDPMGEQKYVSAIKTKDLYDMLELHSANKKRLISSLVALGSCYFQIYDAKTGMSAGYPLWSFKERVAPTQLEKVAAKSGKILTKKNVGRAGTELVFDFSQFVIPPTKPLFADAYLAARLQKPTSQAIFWNLICRGSWALEREEWQEALGASGRVDKWYDRQFLPALAELGTHGYTAEEKDGKIVVRRPQKQHVFASSIIV